MTRPRATRPDTTLRGSDYCIALASVVAMWLGGHLVAALTTPPTPPAPHYCFRADPPPCEMSVR